MTTFDQHFVDDLDFAKKLQEEYDREAATQLTDVDEIYQNAGAPSTNNSSQNHGDHRRQNMAVSSSAQISSGVSPVDPSLEFDDPNPDIRELFLQFNVQFFWGRLSGIEVKWSPRMTLCAGLCVYEGRGGLCSVRLSLPLLKLRPRKDLIETLLHEMIHAYLFVTDNDRDHDGHGPQFQSHMRRINKATGANISIYHTFHDEVAAYQQHWWRCDGPCTKQPPYFGYVKRAMNRAPSHRDFWWAQHQATCGGSYTKIKEPEGYGQKKSAKEKGKSDGKNGTSKDIRSFIGKGKTLGSSGTSSTKGGKTTPKFITNGKNTSTSGKNSSHLFSSVISGKSKTSEQEEKEKKLVVVNGVLTKISDSGTSSDSAGSNGNRSFVAGPSSASPSRGATGGEVNGKDESTTDTGKDKWPEEDDDDSWVFDVDAGISEPVPQKSKEPSAAKPQRKKSEPVVDLSQCDSPFKTEKRNGKDLGKNRKVGKDRPGSFFSVCEERDTQPRLFTKKKPKVKKKYVFDELDSNEGLWEEGYTPKTSEGERKDDCKKTGKSPFVSNVTTGKKNIKSEVGKRTNDSKILVKPESEYTSVWDKGSKGKKIKKEQEDYLQERDTSNNLSNTSKVQSWKHDASSVTDHLPDIASVSRTGNNQNSQKKNTFNSKGSFAGQGFVLGSSSEGQTYLSQIRKTFSKGQNSSSNGNSSSSTSGASYMDRLNGAVPTKNIPKSSSSHYSQTKNTSADRPASSGSKKRKSNEAFEPDDSVDSDEEFCSTKTAKRSDISQRTQCSVTENVELEQGASGGDNGGDDQFVTCPVCCVQVSEAAINAHLDTCLES